MLWLRGLIFTLLVPSVVGGYVPHLFAGGRGLQGGWWQLGWCPVAAGTFVYVLCLLDFLRSGGTPSIFFLGPLNLLLGDAPPGIVRDGLYRVSRNPMYIGVITAVFGQAVIYASSRIAWYGVFLCGWFHLVVVAIEEPHLRKKNGESYKEYCRRVPRWFGVTR
jgi:protein-S-isoprenylcysteine O-methyltransferase Ste14